MGERTDEPGLCAGGAQRYRRHPHSLSDTCVNPPRLRGGFSVAEATALSLPVLSFVCSDGGDKLGALAAPATATYLGSRATPGAHDESRLARRNGATVCG